MPFYTDLQETKRILEIPEGDTSEDVKLTFFIEQASSIVEEFLGRPGLSYKSRTEFYNGTGTHSLLLRSRPVYTDPTIQVWVDQGAYWGAASGSFASTTALTYGTDFALKIDQDDGTSRSGILYRMNKVWPRPTARDIGYLSPYLSKDHGSVKVTYSAGYTVDNLPAGIRFAVDLLIARMRYIMPVGMEVGQDSYEERSLGLVTERRDYLLSLVKPHLFPYRNWNWGG